MGTWRVLCMRTDEEAAAHVVPYPGEPRAARRLEVLHHSCAPSGRCTPALVMGHYMACQQGMCTCCLHLRPCLAQALVASSPLLLDAPLLISRHPSWCARRRCSIAVRRRVSVCS